MFRAIILPTFGIWVLGVRVQGLGLRVRVSGLGLRVKGLGFSG